MTRELKNILLETRLVSYKAISDFIGIQSPPCYTISKNETKVKADHINTNEPSVEPLL